MSVRHRELVAWVFFLLFVSSMALPVEPGSSATDETRGDPGYHAFLFALNSSLGRWWEPDSAPFFRAVEMRMGLGATVANVVTLLLPWIRRVSRVPIQRLCGIVGLLALVLSVEAMRHVDLDPRGLGYWVWLTSILSSGLWAIARPRAEGRQRE